MTKLREITQRELRSAHKTAAVGAVVSVIAATAILAFLLHQSRNQVSRLKAESAMSEGPELSSVISELKRQIAQEEERAAANNEADLLVLKNVDLEISFTVRQERNVEGKLEPRLIAVTDSTSVSSERVQKITFHLSPAQPDLHRFTGSDGLTSQAPPPKKEK